MDGCAAKENVAAYWLELADKELADVCKLLIDNGVAGLPINLYAPDYTDFSVEIFKHRKSMQARRFARSSCRMPLGGRSARRTLARAVRAPACCSASLSSHSILTAPS